MTAGGPRAERRRHQHERAQPVDQALADVRAVPALGHVLRRRPAVQGDARRYRGCRSLREFALSPCRPEICAASEGRQCCCRGYSTEMSTNQVLCLQNVPEHREPFPGDACFVHQEASLTRRCRVCSSLTARRRWRGDPAQLWAQHRDPELPNPQCPEHHGRHPSWYSVRRALRQAWELNDAAKAERLIRNLAQRMEQEAPGGRLSDDGSSDRSEKRRGGGLPPCWIEKDGPMAGFTGG